MFGIGLQDMSCIKTAIGKYNLIIKSSILRVHRATQLGHIARISVYLYNAKGYIRHLHH